MPYLFTLLFFLHAVIATAQSGTAEIGSEAPDSGALFSCENGKKLSLSESSAWSRKVQKRYKQVSALEADFSQISYLKSLDIEENSSGIMRFVNPGKLRWEYEAPEKQIFLVRGEEFELYQPLDGQIIRQDIKSYFSSDVPIAFLLGLGDLQKSFRVTSGCSLSSEVLLTLLPENAGEGTRKIEMKVSTEDSMPSGIRIEDSDGNITTFLLNNRILKKTLADNTFTLNIPEGTDVQDLRRTVQ